MADHSILSFGQCAFGRCALLGMLLAALPALAGAQTIAVQNGGTIALENGGVWDLSGSTTVDLGGTGSTSSISENGTARFANGTLEATRDLNGPSQADPAGLGAKISASKDLGATTVVRGHAVQNAPNGNEGIARYYEVSPSQNNSGLSATLTLRYRDEELNGLTESTLELFKSTDGGQTWSEEGQDSRDANANTVTLSGVGSFSRWTLGSTASPLPVEMAGFEATATEGDAKLTWQTASEMNNAGFEVQRRTSENAGWTQIGYVESKAEGGTHQFRLRQVDLSGSSTLTDPISVTIQMQEAVKLNAPAPNPATGSAALSFAVKEQAETRITLYNVLGQRVRTLYRGTPTAGESQRIRLEATGLPSGVYLLRLRAGGQAKTRRLTVVR